MAKRSKKKPVEHILVRRIFIYSSVAIFAMTILCVTVQLTFSRLVLNYIAPDVYVLGEEEMQVDIDRELEQSMQQLEEEKRATEKEISELNSGKLYEKTLIKPTLSPEKIYTGEMEDKEGEIVADLIAKDVIDRLDAESTGTDSGVVAFKHENNEDFYKIAGFKDYKFLGFIPVTHAVTAIVSSETGEVVSTEKSFFTEFVDFLSP